MVSIADIFPFFVPYHALTFDTQQTGDASAVPSRLREREVRADPASGPSQPGARAFPSLVSKIGHSAANVPPRRPHGPHGRLRVSASCTAVAPAIP